MELLGSYKKGEREGGDSGPFVLARGPSDSDLVIAALRRGVPVRVLMLGDDSAVGRVLAQIEKHCRQPLYDCCSAELNLPASRATVILRDVSTLRVHEQQQVLAWMTDRGADSSVLATSAESLFPLVMSGAFSPALFYRLNVITIECVALPETTSCRGSCLRRENGDGMQLSDEARAGGPA